MVTQEQETIRRESPPTARRFAAIVYNVGEFLADTALTVDNRPWSQRDVNAVEQFLIASAPYADPRINQSYWEHLILASIYARKLAEKTGIMNPDQAEATLLLHDVGKLANPRYLMGDVLGHAIFRKGGVLPSFDESITPVKRILGFEQPAVADIQDESIEQILEDAADNIGKKVDGKLLDKKTMEVHDMAQPQRVSVAGRVYPLEIRAIQALIDGKQALATGLLLDELRWLEKTYGVDFDQLRSEIEKEYNLPKHQAFLYELLDAQETLDPNLDRLLGRPPIDVVAFDVGDVLFQGKNGEALDDELVRRLCSYFSCSQNTILNALATLHKEGMTGVISEQEYCTRFWQLSGGKTPLNLEDLYKPFIHPDLYQPNKDMQKIIHALSQNPNIRLFVLSNVVGVLASVMIPRLQTCYPKIPAENVFVSCQLGMAKGINDNVYNVFLERVGAKNPQSVLLIDDRRDYTTEFRKSGARGFTFVGNPYAYAEFSASQRLERELQKAGII